MKQFCLAPRLLSQIPGEKSEWGGSLLSQNLQFVFQLVRHPMYGGLLLLCIGLSITGRRWDKMVLSVILGLVLHKNKLHKDAYCVKHKPPPNLQKTGKPVLKRGNLPFCWSVGGGRRGFCCTSRGIWNPGIGFSCSLSSSREHRPGHCEGYEE